MYNQGGYGGQGGYPGEGYNQGGYGGGQQGYQQQGFQQQQGGYFGGGQPWSRRDFIIVSEMNGKVIDIKGENPNPGAHIHMWHKKQPPTPNQLWYKDQQGVLRSALNDFAITANRGEKAKLEPFQMGQSQEWIHEGNRIINRADGQCLDIFGAHSHDGADVGSYEYGSKSNQHWIIEYIN